jgi:hypothetical protein
MRRTPSPCCARAASGRAADERDELASSHVEHGPPPEGAVPDYRRLSMHRNRPEVLGEGLNRSESTDLVISTH